MTREELNNKSFEEVMEQLNEEWDDVHTYESMADFVGDLILNQNDIYLAIHMLEAMRDDSANWYLYDFTMVYIFAKVSPILILFDLYSIPDKGANILSNILFSLIVFKSVFFNLLPSYATKLGI